MFITLDGRHGVGKTFLAKALSEKLRSYGYKVFATSEPTVSEIGLFARQAENNYVAETLVCLFAADRYNHVLAIREKLKEGYVVVCDRYIFSAIVLQGIDGVDVRFVVDVNRNIVIPDVSIVVSADGEKIQQNVLERDRVTRTSRVELEEGRDRFLESLSLFRPLTKKLIIYKNDFSSPDIFIDSILKIVMEKT